jgi:hypothetical protein
MMIVASALLCVLVSAGVPLLVRHLSWVSLPLVFLALAVILGNLWYTPLHANTKSLYDVGYQTYMPSFNEQLVQGPPAQIGVTDGVLFYRIYRQTKGGEDYFRAFADALKNGWGVSAGSMANFRTPWLFWFWSALPSAPWIPIVYLLLVTLAVLSVALTTMASVKLPLAIPGAAAVAAAFALTPAQFTLFMPDLWAAVIAVCALAAFAWSTRSERWRAWTVAAVALTVLAVLLRESFAFWALAGVVAAFLGDRAQRRFRVSAWGAGMLVLVAANVAQYVLTLPYVHAGGGFSMWGRGGVAYLLAAFQSSAELLGRGGWLPAVLGVLGLVGVLLAPDVRLKAFASLGVFATLASFLVIGNYAVDAEQANTVVNSWGVAVAPMLYAMLPTAFVALREARARRED